MGKLLEELSIVLCEGLPLNFAMFREEGNSCNKKEKANSICQYCKKYQEEYNCNKYTKVKQYSFNR